LADFSASPFFLLLIGAKERLRRAVENMSGEDAAGKTGTNQPAQCGERLVRLTSSSLSPPDFKQFHFLKHVITAHESCLRVMA
jgi:hypothetical protein